MAAQDHLSREQFYHVSDSRNRDSIASDGLSMEHGIAGNDRIWMYDNLDSAKVHQQMFSTNDMHGNPVTHDIWKVNGTGLRSSKDKHVGGGLPGGRTVSVAIEPTRLSRT